MGLGRAPWRTTGSRKERWFAARSAGPRAGIRCAPSTWRSHPTRSRGWATIRPKRTAMRWGSRVTGATWTGGRRPGAAAPRRDACLLLLAVAGERQVALEAHGHRALRADGHARSHG